MGTVPQQPSQPVILPRCLPLRQTEEIVERSLFGQLPGTPDHGFAAHTWGPLTVVTQTMVLPASPFPTASQLLNARRGPNSVVLESAQTVPLLVTMAISPWTIRESSPSDVCHCYFNSILHCTVGAFPHCPFVVVGKYKILSAYTSTLLGIPLHPSPHLPSAVGWCQNPGGW